uniref:Uncharacterized protein n=1 Tax=Glossina pallidipes TaxID=7398 RepID=A0A1B0ABY2_GLOPL
MHEYIYRCTYKISRLPKMSVEMKVTVTAKDREAVDKIVTFNNQLKVPGRKRSSSIVDDEIIQKNLRELMDKKNRSGLLAGILVPAVIMISFGGWVVVLTKRDKARRALFEKYLEEVAIKNKRELEAKAKLKQFKKTGDKRRLSKDTISLHYENELNKEKSNNNNTLLRPLEFTNIVVTSATRHEHRKHRKHREQILLGQNGAKASHYATKDLRFKRPSLRQKLFGSRGVYQMQQQQQQQQQPQQQQQQQQQRQQRRKISFTISKTRNQQNDPKTLTQLKRKRLQRHNALTVPTMVRTSSAP